LSYKRLITAPSALEQIMITLLMPLEILDLNIFITSAVVDLDFLLRRGFFCASEMRVELLSSIPHHVVMLALLQSIKDVFHHIPHEINIHGCCIIVKLLTENRNPGVKP